MPVGDSDGMPVTIGGGGQRTILVPWGCERIKNGKAADLYRTRSALPALRQPRYFQDATNLKDCV